MLNSRGHLNQRRAFTRIRIIVAAFVIGSLVVGAQEGDVATSRKAASEFLKAKYLGDASDAYPTDRILTAYLQQTSRVELF